MTIQQQIVLRHRSEGHIRFDVPEILCAPELGARLVEKLRAFEGIYRVDLYARQGKLSIRYMETACDFGAVARRLYALVRELCAALNLRPAKVSAPQTTERQANAPVPVRWVRDKLQEAWETLVAAGIVIRRSFGFAGGALSNRPRWMTEFLNDLLMLYLIKIHWHSILSLWLPNPWQYRYEWAATFYLIYLSVQSRLPFQSTPNPIR
jgi:hypothetical protein